MAYAFVENQHLTDIANSIRSKTGSQATMKVSEMSSKIDNIPTGSPLIISDCSYLFSNDARRYQVNDILPYCHPTEAVGLFNNSALTTSIDLSNFDTSNLDNFNSMFQYCRRLTSLNISNFDTSNAVYMMAMFEACNELSVLDLSSFNTSRVNNMMNMFYQCYKLETLDISNFDFSNVTSYNSIFYDCGTQTTTGLTMVYVKNQTAQNWILNLSDDYRPSTWSTDNVIIKS